MDWKECCERRVSKRIKTDIDMVKSLIETSSDKWESQKILELTKVTSSSKFSLAYDSLRELLEALSIEKGYKIYNHECYTAFLKEIIEKSSLGDDFDEIRKIRNAVNYYGKKLDPEETFKLIEKVKEMRATILNIFETNSLTD